MDNNRRDLMVKVAKMYYLDELSQDEIAQQINLSRSNVSRILKACIDEKIVEFKINGITSQGIELREKLIELFNLKDAVVVPSDTDSEKNKRNIAKEGAAYLESVVKDGMLVGISWGTTLYYLVKEFKPAQTLRADVIQLTGAIGSKIIDIDGQELAKRLADAMNGTCYVLRAPLLVQNKVLRDLFFQEADVIKHIERFKDMNIVVTGIGHNDPGLSALRKSGDITIEQCEKMVKEGAIGDICGNKFDINGNICITDISDKTISIELNRLKDTPIVIGVAGGIKKKDAIIGALRGGYVNVLITDELTALSIVSSVT